MPVNTHLQDEVLLVGPLDDAVGLLALPAALPRDLHKFKALWTQERTRLRSKTCPCNQAGPGIAGIPHLWGGYTWNKYYGGRHHLARKRF